MPVTVRWGTPMKQYLVYEFSGKWSGRDLYDTIPVGWQMLHDAGYEDGAPYYVIADLENTDSLAADSVGYIMQRNKRSRYRIEAICLVGSSRTLTRVLNFFNLVAPRIGKKYIPTKSMTEAEQIILKRLGEQAS